MSKSLNKSQEIVNTKVQGGTRMGMMDYLKTVVALFLATAVTASAVQLDGYHILDEQKVTEGGDVVKDDEGNPVTYTVYDKETDSYTEKEKTEDGTVVTDENGDTVTEFVVIHRLEDTDTSTFTTFEEYKNLIDTEISTKSKTKSLRAHNLAHPNHGSGRYNDILKEMVDRGIATNNEIATYLIDNVKALCRINTWWSNNLKYFDTISDTISALESIDPQAVDLTTVDMHNTKRLALIAAALLEGADSRTAFDNVWEINELKYSGSSEYDLRRAQYYHAVLGNSQQAYDMLLNLVVSGDYEAHILATIVGDAWLIDKGDIPATEEMLWEIVDSVSTDWYNDGRISNMVEYWNDGIDWTSYTPQEALDICNKYLMAVTVNETTAPFITAVKEKRRTMEDMVD